MNAKISALLFALFPLISFGQAEMDAAWTVELEHKIIHTGTGLEGNVSYAANEKEMSVFKNDDGSILWSKAFKDMAPRLKNR